MKSLGGLPFRLSKNASGSQAPKGGASQSRQETVSILAGFAAFGGMGAAVLGCVILLAWLLEANGLARVPRNLLTIHPATAAGLILAGVSLRLTLEQGSWARRSARWCAALVFIGGAASLAALFGWDIGSGDALLRGRALSGLAFVRMEPAEILALLLAGAALLLEDFGAKKGRAPSQYLCVVGLAIALLTIVSYGYGIRPLFDRRVYTHAMQLNAALAFAVLFLGSLCARPDRGLMALAISESPGGSTVRHLLPAMIIIPTMLAWLRLGIQNAGLLHTATGSSLFGLASVLILAGLVWWNARSLNEAAWERERAERRMLEAAELKEEFAGMVSHELRAPLTAMKASLDVVLAESGCSLDARSRRFLDIVSRSADRLARLVDDVLDLHALGSGGMRFRMEPADLNELMEQSFRTLEPQARSGGLELSMELGRDLPGVSVDKDRITQVVVNLVNNAVKYAARGRVTIRTRSVSRAVRVEVQDEGDGIRLEDQGKLFRRFGRLPCAGGSKGTGLGLAICKEIVEGHRGSLGVESEPGKGAVFYFTLPSAGSA
jgi:signal transduction histidine kinase